MNATLIMRDRETDSWWSIMTSDAIGGPLNGLDLPELPLGEKTTWGDWVRHHPNTLILSVDGKESDPINRYDGYLSSDRTFRDITTDDDRLQPKDAIYSFHLGGFPYAAPHAAIAGGKLFIAGGEQLFLHRQPGASLFASTDAYIVDRGAIFEITVGELRERLAHKRMVGLTRLDGFDTFWYSWVNVNRETRILR